MFKKIALTSVGIGFDCSWEWVPDASVLRFGAVRDDARASPYAALQSNTEFQDCSNGSFDRFELLSRARSECR